MQVGCSGVRARIRQWLASLGCLLVVGTGVALAASASQASDPATEPAVVVVRPDDTLWSVAERHRPSRDPYAVIEAIRRLNDLPDHTIHAGQQLLVPDG